MKNKLLLATLLSLPATMAHAAMEDDPTLSMFKIDQFERRFTDGPDPFVFEGEGWIGKDLNKLWLKGDYERVDGETEVAELQVLYSRAIAPFWDLQAGWRHDFNPKPSRDWATIGFKGLAPYFFEVDAALFVGETGQIGARLQGEYEILFTQKLILTPEIETNLYSKDDADIGLGSGLADLELGLRLRYEIRREFAPYIGINWERSFGQTADFARAEGESTSDFQFVAGIRAWF